MLGLLIAALSFGGLTECTVSSGRIFSCSATGYAGTAVVQHDGLYRSCKVANGRVQTCGGSFQGTAPVKKGGYWKKCRIANGRVFSCGAHWSGKVVTR
jgi:hypothetical protein